MGQMDLATLKDLGEASERLARCFQTDRWDELLREVAAPLEALVNARGDRRSMAMPHSLSLGNGMYSPGADEWHTQIWTNEEASCLSRGAGWCFNTGRRRGYEDQDRRFYERVSQLGLNPTGHYLELELRMAASGVDLTPISIRLSQTSGEMSLHALLGSHVSGLRRPERRDLIQALDALTRGLDVTVALSWSPTKVRDSVMAQIAGWYVRIEGRTYAEGQSTLTGDAYNWLLQYAARVAGRRRSELALSEVHDVARRSVRPPSAAAHHSYWKKSLRHRPEDDLATRSGALAGVSRRTVFVRLKKANKALADFASSPNPADALGCWLLESAPAARLPAARRELIDGLVEVGMPPESARKLERRVRGLAPDEQRRRIERSVSRKRRAD